MRSGAAQGFYTLDRTHTKLRVAARKPGFINPVNSGVRRTLTYVDIGCGLQPFEVNVYPTGERGWGKALYDSAKEKGYLHSL